MTDCLLIGIFERDADVDQFLNQGYGAQKMNAVTLFTVQTPGHDITVRHGPGEDYTDANGPFCRIAEYLGWKHWAWTFPSLQDFNNEWLVMEKISKGNLWELSVPESEIRWCAMNLQCENQEPVEDWFYPNPESIRAMGDIPQGLVKSPVRSEWVKKVLPTTDAFHLETKLLCRASGSPQADGCR
jgi:hypothetical protein